MYTHTQIDPLVSFRNAEGEPVRGTLVNLQRKSLIMEVYNPYSIVQVSEVLNDVMVRMGSNIAYQGKAVVTSLLNTGLTAIVSVTLTDGWQELDYAAHQPGALGAEARAFVEDWNKRFQLRPGYLLVVNEMRAYLSEVSRWVEQVDLSESLPKDESGKLRKDVFDELSAPLLEKVKYYFSSLTHEATQVCEEGATVHRSYAQSALHPLLLRAPFVYRAYSKPLGYAGDYLMVKQMLDDPRQGPNTYFQMVNAAFLQAAVVVAHRNRIDLLVDFLKRTADKARQAGKTYKVLNVGCGPAVEIQRFIREYPQPECLSFELVDFNQETLDWTRRQLGELSAQHGKNVAIKYVNDSVHKLLKRRAETRPATPEFNAAYCAGLFDYLSDKICSRLNAHFASLIQPGGSLLFTNVHSDNPERAGMEHLLEWYLIYRDEAGMKAALPDNIVAFDIYVEATGVNIFAEATIA